MRAHETILGQDAVALRDRRVNGFGDSRFQLERAHQNKVFNDMRKPLLAHVGLTHENTDGAQHVQGAQRILETARNASLLNSFA